MKAVVFGGAACVHDDFRRLEDLYGPWDGLVIAVNDIGTHLEQIDHWVTLHPDKMVEAGTDPDHPEGWPWEKQRREKGLADGYVTWTHKPNRGTMKVVKSWGGGSSGLLGVCTAYEIGCQRVVLCGVPMDDGAWFEGSVTHDASERFTSVDSHRRVWRRTKDKLIKRVRSMSGWTKEMLGEPTLEWLEDDDG